MDTRTLYYLEIPEDQTDPDGDYGDIRAFIYLSTMPSGDYCMKEADSDMFHGILLISPEDFEQLQVQDEEMILTPDLMQVIYQYGNAKQQKIWTYSPQFGICQGEITKVGPEFFVSVSKNNVATLMDVNLMGILWKGSTSAETLEPWITTMAVSDTPVSQFICDYHTSGLNEIENCTDLQIVLKLQPKTAYYALEKLAQKQFEEGLELYDGMELDDLFNSMPVRLMETTDKNGNQIFRIIIPDPEGRDPGDAGIAPPFSLQDKPYNELFPE